MNTVGEPCEGKPHARFDEGRLARRRTYGSATWAPGGKPPGNARRPGGEAPDQSPTLLTPGAPVLFRCYAPAMRFGLHPAYLLLLVFVLVILVGGAFALGWGFRKGWEAGGRRPDGPTDAAPGP